ncbi:50S ribosomal protein L18 [Thermodesulfobacteriota bacterium]
MAAFNRAATRIKRKKRVRKKVKGTPTQPRLTVFRSSKHIYAQIIDDTTAKTLVDSSSMAKDLRNQDSCKGGNKDGASIIGKSIAGKALEKGIKKVVFDRNGFLYHGRVKALAESARKAGLEF